MKLENLLGGMAEELDFLTKKIEQYERDLEAKLTLITCENKGTMRLIVKCTMSEVLLTHE